jgi:pimeloyl-ACP methyl ester carboxylesterase/class 3 adenylate cyclase
MGGEQAPRLNNGHALLTADLHRAVKAADLETLDTLMLHHPDEGDDHSGVMPKTRWAKTIDGASIAYQDFGGGPVTLLVIHGWISHLEVYWEQPRFARFMRRLSRNMRVLHFDKRGVGMSDRFGRPPDLETRMDDVRAVMDAAGVERAALFGWGTGGSPLAVFFAATHPERTLAICVDPDILERRSADYRWGWGEDELERIVKALVDAWGDEERTAAFVAFGFGKAQGEAPADDPEFCRWAAKWARFSATPSSFLAFEWMWNETDVRDVLASVQSPTLVLHKKDARTWARPGQAAYLADRIPGARLVGVPGIAPVVWVEDPELYVTEIEKFLSSVRAEEAELDRVLATVLFTDIVGSTAKAADLGDRRWRDLVQRHHATVRALLARYRGNEVDTAGDGFFASFDGPARAVRCAGAIVQAVKPLGIEIRAGLHTGECDVINGKIGGMAVYIGARVGSLAGPSEIMVSQTVKDLVAGSGLAFGDVGEHELKGVPDRWRIYRVVG